MAPYCVTNSAPSSQEQVGDVSLPRAMRVHRHPEVLGALRRASKGDGRRDQHEFAAPESRVALRGSAPSASG